MDMLAEVEAFEPAAGKQAVAKMRYTHTDLIDFIIANPGVSQGQLAIRYGYTQSWVSLVMSSDAFKSAMAQRRTEIVDPTLLVSVNERFEAMTTKSLERLMEKLEAPVVSDNVVLKAVELGAKAMGVGGNAVPVAPQGDRLEVLAQRLISLQSNVRKGMTYEGQTVLPETVSDAGSEAASGSASDAATFQLCIDSGEQEGVGEGDTLSGASERSEKIRLPSAPSFSPQLSFAF